LNEITQQIRGTFETFIDPPRRGNNTRYTMVDAALSASKTDFQMAIHLLEADGIDRLLRQL
jgi:hypothetical protein